MLFISTFRNLSTLQASSYPDSLKYYVSELFEGLYQSSSEQPQESFELESLGSIVVFEPGDRLAPILKSVPFGLEYIEKSVIQGTPIYRIGCMSDNDLIAQYVILAEWLDGDEKQLLAQFEVQGGDSDGRK